MSIEPKGNLCPSSDSDRCWKNINFREAERAVKKLQHRITTAMTKNEFDKAEALIHMLTHSYYAKCLAVYCVCNNRGNKTAGVDDKILVTCGEKYDAAVALRTRGYKSDVLLRKNIPKANGTTRPLGIPTMRDRAMQTLYRFALEPVAELTGDEHSYGFRPGRSTQDAIIRCLDVLNDPARPHYVLEGDILSCFDNISHQWIIDNIPVDKKVLRQFIECGYVMNGKLFDTTKGVPQGGCISPVICNMVLDGIEPLIEKETGKAVQFIRYADDFVVIGKDIAALEQTVIPLLDDFLSVRGLQLSREKTRIAHVDNGFDFLGWHLQRYGAHTFAIPSVKNTTSILTKVQAAMYRSYTNRKQQEEFLKAIIRGWVNYHRGIVPPIALYEVEFDIVSLMIKSGADRELIALASSLFYFV